MILPADNDKDLEEIDQTVRAALQFMPVERWIRCLRRRWSPPLPCRRWSMMTALPHGTGCPGPAGLRQSEKEAIMAINFNKAEFVLSAAAPKDFLRDGLPQVAFAGRSNVGKSSVINRLLNRKNFARVGAAPGKTIQINYFRIDGSFYLVDLPGYGYAKVSKEERDRWGRLMESYFAGAGADDAGRDDRGRPAQAHRGRLSPWPSGSRRRAAPWWWWPTSWTS